MNHRYVSTVIVGVVLMYLPLCAFGQSSLTKPSDEQRLIIAQESDGGAAAYDRAFWDSVKDSKNPDELKAYLERFPTGVFAPLARVRLKTLETGSAQSEPGKPEISAVTNAKEIARDGSFIAYDDGTVLDTRTNLMWAAKDNGGDIYWADAKKYCENYAGGGYTDWRMPKLDELAGLYDVSKTYQTECTFFLLTADLHVTELIRITCYAPWAADVLAPNAPGNFSSSSQVACFSFNSGKRIWMAPSESRNGRALPVRSVK